MSTGLYASQQTAFLAFSMSITSGAQPTPQGFCTGSTPYCLHIPATSTLRLLKQAEEVQLLHSFGGQGPFGLRAEDEGDAIGDGPSFVSYGAAGWDGSRVHPVSPVLHPYWGV